MAQNKQIFQLQLYVNHKIKMISSYLATFFMIYTKRCVQFSYLKKYHISVKKQFIDRFTTALEPDLQPITRELILKECTVK